MEFFLKDQLVYAVDKIVSLKSSPVFHRFFKDFPNGSSKLNLILLDEKEDVKFVRANPGETIVRLPPKTIESEIHPNFREIFKFQTQGTFIVFLKNARVIFDKCYIVTKKGFLVDELNPLFNRGVSPIFYNNKLPQLKKVGGKVVVLSNSDNYFHWLFEIIPKLIALKKKKVKFDYCVTGFDRQFKKETLKKFGISESKIIPANNTLHVFADELIVPGFETFDSGNPTPETCKFIRTAFLKTPSIEYKKKYKKIFVRRGNVKYRKILNENAVADYLVSKGFISVTLDKMSVEEQSMVFNSAEVIIAPHGAALSNLVFSKKGVKVIEIFNPSYVNVCFWALCNIIKGDYYYFFSEKIKFNINQDSLVDLNKLQNAINLCEGKI